MAHLLSAGRREADELDHQHATPSFRPCNNEFQRIKRATANHGTQTADRTSRNCRSARHNRCLAPTRGPSGSAYGVKDEISGRLFTRPIYPPAELGHAISKLGMSHARYATALPARPSTPLTSDCYRFVLPLPSHNVPDVQAWAGLTPRARCVLCRSNPLSYHGEDRCHGKRYRRVWTCRIT